jgi:hypothetical protein
MILRQCAKHTHNARPAESSAWQPTSLRVSGNKEFPFVSSLAISITLYEVSVLGLSTVLTWFVLKLKRR